MNGIEVTTKVSVSQRSLKIEDYGKIAATFVHLKSGRAVRLFPKTGLRELARKYTRDEQRAYFVQLIAYQIIPDEELLDIEPVALTQSLKEIIGLPGQKTTCSLCGEQIINGREAWGAKHPPAWLVQVMPTTIQSRNMLGWNRYSQPLFAPSS